MTTLHLSFEITTDEDAATLLERLIEFAETLAEDLDDGSIFDEESASVSTAKPGGDG